MRNLQAVCCGLTTDVILLPATTGPTVEQSACGAKIRNHDNNNTKMEITN